MTFGVCNVYFYLANNDYNDSNNMKFTDYVHEKLVQARNQQENKTESSQFYSNIPLKVTIRDQTFELEKAEHIIIDDEQLLNNFETSQIELNFENCIFHYGGQSFQGPILFFEYVPTREYDILCTNTGEGTLEFEPTIHPLTANFPNRVVHKVTKECLEPFAIPDKKTNFRYDASTLFECVNMFPFDANSRNLINNHSLLTQSYYASAFGSMKDHNSIARIHHVHTSHYSRPVEIPDSYEIFTNYCQLESDGAIIQFHNCQFICENPDFHSKYNNMSTVRVTRFHQANFYNCTFSNGLYSGLILDDCTFANVVHCSFVNGYHLINTGMGYGILLEGVSNTIHVEGNHFKHWHHCIDMTDNAHATFVYVKNNTFENVIDSVLNSHGSSFVYKVIFDHNIVDMKFGFKVSTLPAVQQTFVHNSIIKAYCILFLKFSRDFSAKNVYAYPKMLFPTRSIVIQYNELHGHHPRFGGPNVAFHSTATPGAIENISVPYPIRLLDMDVNNRDKIHIVSLISNRVIVSQWSAESQLSEYLHLIKEDASIIESLHPHQLYNINHLAMEIRQYSVTLKRFEKRDDDIPEYDFTSNNPDDQQLIDFFNNVNNVNCDKVKTTAKPVIDIQETPKIMPKNSL